MNLENRAIADISFLEEELSYIEGQWSFSPNLFDGYCIACITERIVGDFQGKPLVAISHKVQISYGTHEMSGGYCYALVIERCHRGWVLHFPSVEEIVRFLKKLDKDSRLIDHLDHEEMDVLIYKTRSRGEGDDQLGGSNQAADDG